MSSYSLGNVATHMKGATLDAFAVAIGATGAPTLVDNARSGFVTSVVRNSAGLYTFTLSVPVPAKIIGDPMAFLSCINATGAVLQARYVAASYNATAGTFQIAVTNTDGAPVATDPTQNTQMTVLLCLQRYTNI